MKISLTERVTETEKNVCFLLWSQKNRVGTRSVKRIFLALLFWSKMCVLWMFYVDWELGGPKELWGRDFFD